MKRIVFILPVLLALLAIPVYAQVAGPIPSLNGGGVYEWTGEFRFDTTVTWAWLGPIPIDPCVAPFNAVAMGTDSMTQANFTVGFEAVHIDSAASGGRRQQVSIVMKGFLSSCASQPTTQLGLQRMTLGQTWGDSTDLGLTGRVTKFRAPATYQFISDSAALSVTVDDTAAADQQAAVTSIQASAKPVPKYLWIRAVPTWTGLHKGYTHVWVHVTGINQYRTKIDPIFVNKVATGG